MKIKTYKYEDSPKKLVRARFSALDIEKLFENKKFVTKRKDTKRNSELYEIFLSKKDVYLDSKYPHIFNQVSSNSVHLILSGIPLEKFYLLNPIGLQAIHQHKIYRWKYPEALTLRLKSNNSCGINLIESELKIPMEQRLFLTKLESLFRYEYNEGISTYKDLFSTKFLINLLRLHMPSNYIGVKGIKYLAETKFLINVTLLNLNDNDLGDEGAKLLASNVTIPTLEVLMLTKNSIGLRGIKELSQNLTWTHLTHIDLGHNFYFGMEGAHYLSRNETWTNLQVIDFSGNNLGFSGIREISKNLVWKELKKLIISHNNIAKFPYDIKKNFEKVEVLCVSFNELGDQGVIEIAKIPHMNLININLQGNLINDKGIISLSKNNTWSNLKTLNLSNNNITSKGIKELIKNKCWRKLQILKLSINDIGDNGASSLASNLTWNELTELDIAGNNISYSGISAFAKYSSWVKLKYLDVSINDIKNRGAKELANNIRWKELVSLNLEYNYDIDFESSKVLMCNKNWTNLEFLKLNGNLLTEDQCSYLRELSKTIKVSFQSLDSETDLKEVKKLTICELAFS